MHNLVKIELDITGTNPNNRISGEPHTLSGNSYRSIAPNYGPFFTSGLIIKDGANTLIRGTHFQCVELHQEATLKYGKEIASVILIIDSQVSSNVEISYNVLGGHYSYSDASIANIYESVVNDNRPVAWENIFNKPVEYPPTIHRHLLDDVYGFEPVVDALERIKRAVTLGQVEVVLEIVNGLLINFKCNEADKVWPINRMISFDHMLFFLSQKKLLSALSLESDSCSYVRGSTINISIDSSRVNYLTNVKWEIYRYGTNISGFMEKEGFVALPEEDSLRIYIPTTGVIPDMIYVGLKFDPDQIDFDAVTYRINILPETTTTCNMLGMITNTYLDTAFINNNAASNDELSIYYGYMYKL